MAAEKEEINKVVLVGDYMVGKTSLFTRFKTGKFDDVEKSQRQQRRAEADVFKKWEVDGEELCITLYDTAGMERFEATVPPTYFRNAMAVILVYAIDNRESIDNITHWAESLTVQRLGDMSQKLVRVLVGNKSDLVIEDAGKREVTKKRGTDTAELFDIEPDLVFEVSALTGEGVDKVFNAVARKINEQGRSARASLPQQKFGPKCC